MQSPVNIESNLEPLCRFLEEEIKKELVTQGHTTTGTLLESVRIAVRKTATGSIIEGFTESYGRYVDTGRAIGIRRVPIEALIGWIRAKGISVAGGKERDIAFAIQHKIFTSGIPADGNKLKTAFITRTLSQTHATIVNEIERAVHTFYGIVLNNIIRDIKGSMI